MRERRDKRGGMEGKVRERGYNKNVTLFFFKELLLMNLDGTEN